MSNNSKGKSPITGFNSGGERDADSLSKNEMIKHSGNYLDTADDVGRNQSTNDFGLVVYLYADTAFDTWKDARENAADVTDDELQYINRYSSYQIAMECNLTSIGADNKTGDEKKGSGCCLKDDTQYGGGYCLIVNEAMDDVDTYYVENSQFTTILETPYSLDDLEVPDDLYTGITVFYISNSGTNMKTFTGTKVQPWPAAGWDSMFRFESGDKATGLVYDWQIGLSSQGADEVVDPAYVAVQQ